MEDLVFLKQDKKRAFRREKLYSKVRKKKRLDLCLCVKQRKKKGGKSLESAFSISVFDN